MTPYARGAFIGACFSASIVGFLTMLAIQKLQRKNLFSPSGLFGIPLVAFCFSLFVMVSNPGQLNRGTRDQVRKMLQEALAGAQTTTGNGHWSDGPTRDMFRELLERNQQYAADIRALDTSATRNLYSADSYADAGHMRKVLDQLRAALAIERKYESVDSIVEKGVAKIAAANAPREEKEEFLKGMKDLDFGLGLRNNMVHSKEDWLDSTINLYEFTLANRYGYFVQSGELRFKNKGIGDEFRARQDKAIELHEAFLKAKRIFAENRENGLKEFGLSSSDLAPEQPGKQN